MKRDAARAQVEGAVAPMLARGERVQRVVPAWALERRGRVPLLFRARDRHVVVLTNQRLVLFPAPRRRRPLSISELAIAKRFSHFTCERLRRLRPLLQVALRTADERSLVLEFRPRDRAGGRELVEAVGGPPPRARGTGPTLRRKRQDDEADPARDDILDPLGP